MESLGHTYMAVCGHWNIMFLRENTAEPEVFYKIIQWCDQINSPHFDRLQKPPRNFQWNINLNLYSFSLQ